MNCPSCGAQYPLGRETCGKCLSELPPPPPPQTKRKKAAAPEYKSYMAWAVLSTFFCCLPFGIVAIVFAAKANAYVESGNHAGARDASETARFWCWVAGVSGLIAIATQLSIYFS